MPSQKKLCTIATVGDNRSCETPHKMFYMSPDPEEYDVCPYNDIHVVLRKRMQYHLVNCRTQYGHLEMKACPYNAKHIIPKVEYSYHLVHCQDRCVVDRDIIYSTVIDSSNHGNCTVPPYEPIVMDCDEDWELETCMKTEPLTSGCAKNEHIMRLPKDNPVVLQTAHPALKMEEIRANCYPNAGFSLGRGRSANLPTSPTNFPTSPRIGSFSGNVALAGIGRGFHPSQSAPVINNVPEAAAVPKNSSNGNIRGMATATPAFSLAGIGRGRPKQP